MAMIDRENTSVAKTAYGKVLEVPIEYSYKWKDYGEYNDVRQANDLLSDDEQVKVRNAERQAAARQASLTKALNDAGIEKPNLENDDQLRLREMFKVLMSSKKYTEERAREIAADQLGLTWAD